jgi:ABC-type multidrug transport system ATPase subunit/pSer/pThr/pTyr-binding forkhead associated (FHA) protein
VTPTESREWEIELAGRRIALSSAGLTLGRDPACDLPLEDERTSWRHLRIEIENGSPVIRDLGSSNGTYLDGKKLADRPARITREVTIQLGSTRLRLHETAESAAKARRFQRVRIGRSAVRIGRAPDNDVVLDEPNVSWHHAEVRPGEPPSLVDLGSRNGTRLGTQLLVQAAGPFPERMPAGIGPYSIVMEGGELVVSDERAGTRLTAEGVSVRVDSLTILHPTGLSVVPGEFVALIGPSGSGKTTFIKCLAGVSAPSAGRITLGFDPLELRQTEVGYVPQSDVVHERLTVTEALQYAAKLRLPSDTSDEELAAAVKDVLTELRLSDHKHTQIMRLSGGQRKRVACGVELIGKPAMLLLDEPTSGLDPALERRLMGTFRGLADSGRGIIVSTHATSSLALCDTVAVMAPGGHLLFAGSPEQALDHFGVSAYDEIYNAIELVEVSPQTDSVSLPRPPRAATRLLSGRSLLSHTAALGGRYARTLVRDRRTLMVLVGQAPIIGLLIALLYPSHLLALPDRQPARSAQFVFLLVTAALWLGLIDSCREIVKERSIILRELAVGVRLDAYILAKAGLLFLLAALQCVLLVGVASLVEPLHASLAAYLLLTGLLILTAWSTVALGLVVSALARSVDQATSVIPLLLIPQLLFGAALVPFARMSHPMRVLSDLMVSRWAFAGAGHVIHMTTRFETNPRVAATTGYDPSFFSLSPAAAAIILGGFTAAMLLLSAIVLARRSRST